MLRVSTSLLLLIAFVTALDCAGSERDAIERRIADNARSQTKICVAQLDLPIRLFMHRTLARAYLSDAKRDGDGNELVMELEGVLQKVLRKDELVGKTIDYAVLVIEG